MKSWKRGLTCSSECVGKLINKAAYFTTFSLLLSYIFKIHTTYYMYINFLFWGALLQVMIGGLIRRLRSIFPQVQSRQSISKDVTQTQKSETNHWSCQFQMVWWLNQLLFSDYYFPFSFLIAVFKRTLFAQQQQRRIRKDGKLLFSRN